MKWEDLKNVAKRTKPIAQKQEEASGTGKSDKFLQYKALGSGVTAFIERYAYEMFVLYIDRMCEQIVSRGFTFNNVKDPLKTTSTKSLADLQNLLAETACQSLINKDTYTCNDKFLSVSEIVRRKYLGDAKDTSVMLEWRKENYRVRGERRFYAFCFDLNSGALPSTRQKLLGIVEVQKEYDKESGAIKFTANLTDEPNADIEFDKNLVFSMPYGEYLNVFLLGFENLVMMIVNSKNVIGSSDYMIFTDTGGYLDKDNKDYQKFIERIQPFVDGETRALVKGTELGLDITKGESAQEVKEVNVDFAKEILSFMTGVPTTILFSENTGGLNSTKETDKEQEEEFLTRKATLDFLPILHTFCDLFQLKDRQNLEFNSYFESMRVLNLTKEFDEDIVDDAIRYKIRESYYKMLNMHGKPPPIEKKEYTEEDE